MNAGTDKSLRMKLSWHEWVDLMKMTFVFPDGWFYLSLSLSHSLELIIFRRHESTACASVAVVNSTLPARHRIYRQIVFIENVP